MDDLSEKFDLPKWVNEFDNMMFLVNPERAIKLWEFLLYIPEFSWLRTKLFSFIKQESSFWKIADNYGFIKNPDYHEIWKSWLQDSINDFIEELRKWKDWISFSWNEIDEITTILNFVFDISLIEKNVVGFGEKLLKLVA